MKSKKLISLLCAAAMTVSSFAGLTISASAAVGDVLINQNFDDADNTTPWGTPVVQSTTAEDGTVTWNKVIGTAYVDSATLGTVPASVTGNVFNFSSDGGNNSPTGTVTLDAATGTAQAYTVSFDAYIKNAKKDSYGDLNGADSPEEAYEYIFGFGDGTNDVIRFNVKGQNIYFVSSGVNIDTGIKTGTEGVWVKADVKCDVAAKSVKGTITPDGGASVNVDASFSAANASSISKLYAASVRFSGNTKGYINNYIDNFVITEVAPIVPCNITVNKKCGDTVLATETVKGGVGESYTAGASYKVPFATAESREAGKYYKYDEASTDTIVAEEGSVINLNFIETDMPTVSFKAATGDSKTPVATIAEVKAVPGENAAIYLREFVKGDDNKWYQKDDGRTGGRGDMYNVSVKAGDSDSVELINYKPAYNVVSFLEAEDSENVVESEDGLAGGTYNTDYIRDYASGGVWAQSTTAGNYPTGFYTEPVAEAGTYEVTVRTRTIKRPAAVAKVTPGEGDAVTMTKIGETKGDAGISVETFKTELAAGEYIWVGKSGEIGTNEASGTKLINDVDYIVVKDANKKADTDPVVTFSYANKVASLTSDKDRTVKAVVIHAQYSNGGVLTDVKQHPVDILSGATPTTVNIEEPVYEGDKFMVWETLDGLKPLLATPYTVPQGGGDAKPKFTVTVADNLANGTVSVDKTQAEQGETVTITATPASDAYELDTITVTDADSNAVTVSESNTFTMPAKNVTVTATFKAKPIAIAGTVTITGTAKVGETLTAAVENLTAGATAKYQWQLATAQNGEFTDVGGATEATKKLSSVSKDKYVRVVVTADGFDGQLVSNVLGPVGEAAAPITKYAITKVVDPADTATVTTTIGDGQEVTEVTDGINVTVNATAVAGNAVSEIIVKADGEDTNLYNAETKTFKMPAKAVTVTVKTVKEYTITKADAENGTFNVSATKAVAGTKISVTDITPAEGYKVDTVKFNETVIEAAEGAYSFTMPAENVTVTVTFKDAIECRAQAVTVTQTYADGASSFAKATAPASYGSFKWSGGTIKYYNESWGTSLMLVKFNVKEEAKLKIKSAKVTFKAAAAKNTAKTTILRLTDDSVDTSDLSKLTLANLLDKSAAMIKDAPFSDATTTAAEKSYDFKDDLRANGSSTYIFYTGGQTINVTDFATDIQLADEPLAQANISIQKVYADENGTIEIGNGKYTAFGDADTVTPTLSTLVGDTYTPADTYKTAIDDGTTRYVYVSGVSPVTLAAQNTIYIVYNKTDYQTTTFTVKLSDAAKAGVVVKVKGTPTDTTAAAVDTTVTTGDDGTATIKLLPGTYKYSIDQATEYLEVAETALTVGQNNDVVLTANSKAGATVTVKYQDADGNELKADKTLTEGLYVGDSFTLSDTEKANIQKDNSDGTKTIYTYDTTSTTTIDALEVTNTVIAKFTNLGDFYEYETFDGSGDGGFNLFSRSRGSGAGSTIASGELKISTNGNYAGVDGAAVYRVIATPYTGKIEISFDASNNGTAGKGAMISLSDATVTAENDIVSAFAETANIADISLKNGFALTVGSATAMDKYDGSKQNYKFVIDFTNGTIDAYYGSTQLDMNGDAEGMTGTITASQLSCIRVKHLNSATDTFIDNLFIKKLPTE